MKGVRAIAALTAGACAVALSMSAGAGSLLYAIVYALAVVPGLPLGFSLFGRRHPAGWVAGGLLGYGLTQLALWFTIASDLASPAGFASTWLVLTVVTAVIARALPASPAVGLPAWSPADWRALLVVLCLVPLLMAPPYRNLGREGDEGNRYYRAYFTADFLWHSALAYELGKFSLPPRNPYLSPRPMNYYWTYFLLPATIAELSPVESLADVQRCLKVNAILSGLLMIAALFLLVRSGVRRPWPAAVAVGLTVLAASAEGLYEIQALAREGRPLAALLDTNIDAITAWRFGGLRVDNIPRSLWYTPQHTTSIALGLVALLAASAGGATAGPRAAAIAGLALGLSTTMNPLLGGVCAMIYGVCIVVDAAATRAWKAIPWHAAAAVPVALAVAWSAVSRVTDGAGSVVDVGFSGFSRHSPVATLLLSLGPVLLPALPGLAYARGTARRPVALAAAGIAVGLFLLYFVRISEASWVGFRAGQVLLVSIAVLLARTFDRLPLRMAWVLSAAILVVGLPTTAIDTWNAQDIGNRRPGPGFRWTLWTTPAQQEAFRWLRRHTPADAVVQMEPMVRGREHWTLIPSFAGRRMAAGLPISLLPLPEYEQRSVQVRAAFATTAAAEASDILRRLRVDYVYLDRDDVAAYPEGAAKFDAAPDQFERLFANGEAAVYRVK